MVSHAHFGNPRMQVFQMGIIKCIQNIVPTYRRISMVNVFSSNENYNKPAPRSDHDPFNFNKTVPWVSWYRFILKYESASQLDSWTERWRTKVKLCVLFLHLSLQLWCAVMPFNLHRRPLRSWLTCKTKKKKSSCILFRVKILMEVNCAHNYV